MIEAVPQIDHRLLAKEAVIGQKFLGTTLVFLGESRILQQTVEHSCGVTSSVILSQVVLTDILKDNLRVPAEELEARAGLLVRIMTAYGVPVMVIPVGIAGILVD